MRRLWPRHVRSRMTLWYVLVLGLLLLAYAGVASSYLFYSLREQLDHDLLEDVERVEGLLENTPDGRVHSSPFITEKTNWTRSASSKCGRPKAFFSIVVRRCREGR